MSTGNLTGILTGDNLPCYTGSMFMRRPGALVCSLCTKGTALIEESPFGTQKRAKLRWNTPRIAQLMMERGIDRVTLVHAAGLFPATLYPILDGTSPYDNKLSTLAKLMTGLRTIDFADVLLIDLIETSSNGD